MTTKLSLVDLQSVGDEYSIPVSHLKALIAVESSGVGFYKDGTPVVQQEPHYFNRLTNGKYLLSHPHLASKSYKANLQRKLYNLSARKRLAESSQLDREAALRSCSWGLFQIMGDNYKLCGYPSVQAFVNGMYQDEQTQLKAAIEYLKSVNGLSALREGDWKTVARKYNGAEYWRKGYDKKLAKAARANAHFDTYAGYA